MTYKDKICQAMHEYAKDKKVVFIGYNTAKGSKAYGTLEGLEDRCIETPVAENLMVGMAIGMSLKGFKPVVWFERHDFLLNALDAIVNHLDKLEKMSNGQFKPMVCVRTCVGSAYPINPGIQHVQNYSMIGNMLNNVETVKLTTNLCDYPKFDKSKFIVEYKELYNTEEK